jgi:hypothetical protein
MDRYNFFLCYLLLVRPVGPFLDTANGAPVPSTPQTLSKYPTGPP